MRIDEIRICIAKSLTQLLPSKPHQNCREIARASESTVVLLLRLLALCSFLLCFFVTTLSLAFADDPAPRERKDSHGDQLPSGCLARLGTTRLHLKDCVYRPVFSPDGRYIVSASESGVFLWDSDTGRLVRRIPERGQNADLSRYAITGDATGIWSVDSNGTTVTQWSLSTGEIRCRISGPGSKISSLVLSSDSRYLAMGDKLGCVYIYDLSTKKQTAQIASSGSTTGNTCPNAGKAVRELRFFKNTTRLIVFSQDNNLCIFDSRNGKLLENSTYAKYSAIEVSPNGEWVTTYSAKGVELINLAAKERHLIPSPMKGCAFDAIFSSDSKTLVTLERAGDHAVLWDVVSGHEIRRLKLRDWDFIINTDRAALSTEGKFLVARDGDSVLRMWDMKNGQTLFDYHGHTAPPNTLIFGTQKDRLVSFAFRDGVIQWDLNALMPICQTFTPETPSEGNAVCLSPGGGLVATVDEASDELILQDTGSKWKLSLPAKHGSIQAPFAFTFDGSTFASVAKDGAIHLWNVTTGRHQRKLEPEKGSSAVAWLEFSHDGTILAGGANPWRVELWDVKTGKPLVPLLWPVAKDDSLLFGTMSEQWHCCFTPDGKKLFTSCFGDWTIVWDLKSGRPVRAFDDSGPMSRHCLLGGRCGLSRDGRFVIAYDRIDRGRYSVCVWEIASGALMCHIPGEYAAAAISIDQRTIATSSCIDASILLWDFPSLIETSLDIKPRLSWESLAEAKPDRAIWAVNQLAKDEQTAIAMLKTHLRPVAKPNAGTLISLFNKLDSAFFAERNQAFAELEGFGEAIRADLKQAAGDGRVEVRKRVIALLEKLDPLAGERLREVRSVQLLEYIGTPPACEVLRQLAGGVPEAILSQEAKKALERLSKMAKFTR